MEGSAPGEARPTTEHEATHEKGQVNLSEASQDLRILKSLAGTLEKTPSDAGADIANRIDQLMELLNDTAKQFDRSPALQQAAAKARQDILALSEDVRRYATQPGQKPRDAFLALLDRVGHALTTIRREGGIDP